MKVCAIFARFADSRTRAYDFAEMPTNERRRKQLVTKTITVPGNLTIACNEFNSGLYFESHESLEEIWQEEQGEVRDLYKGIIQVAAAFVHITRENCTGARRLLGTAIAYMDPYRSDPTVLGIDVDAFCQAAERCLAEVHRLCPDGRLGDFDYSLVPVLSFDAEALRADAVRWDAWGFAPTGDVLPMEIDVIE